MSIISSPYPFVFVNGTIADATQVNADFNYVQSQVNNNAAHNGANSDITSMSALVNITVSGMIRTNMLNATGVSTFAQDVLMTGTGELDLAAGTTAQRSGSPSTGMIRYNTTTNSFEGYGGSPPAWASFTNGASIPMFIDLFVINNPVTPNTQLNVTSAFGQMVSSANFGITRTNVSFTINATTIGVNGLDTGTLSASTIYFIYMIDNGINTAGLLSLSSTSPLLPSGYVYVARAGAVKTNASAQFPLGAQYGNHFVYQTRSIIISSATSSGVATASIYNFVPSTASEACLSADMINISSNPVFNVLVAPNSAFSTSYTFTWGTVGPVVSSNVNMPILASTISVTTQGPGSGGSGTARLLLAGWTDTVAAF